MKKLLFIIGLAFLCFSQNSPAKSKFVEGELLVKYKNGTASDAPFALNKKIGAKVIEEFPALKWQRIKLPKGLSVSQAVSRYASSAEIETAQPNFIYHLQVTPN
ncbi:MAG TPA: hypothetical protein VK892_13500, partial [Pyrinomonadaceae bacterium]|nr:hypothetical protein [Pyrinomonadaceae bacterium]